MIECRFGRILFYICVSLLTIHIEYRRDGARAQSNNQNSETWSFFGPCWGLLRSLPLAQWLLPVLDGVRDDRGGLVGSEVTADSLDEIALRI